MAITTRNRSLPACTRFVPVASFIHRGPAGANRLRLAAFVAVRRLAPGGYRLQSILLDSAGGRHTFYAVLRIKPAPRQPARQPVRMIAILADLLPRLPAAL